MSKMAQIVNSGAGLLLVLLIAVPANGQVINEDLKLMANDGGEQDYFGDSIAINNGVIAVGASRNGPQSFGGAVYLFDAASGSQLHKLRSPDSLDGFFGQNGLAISDGIVAVQASDSNGILFGSVYLFDSTTGNLIAELLPNDGVASRDNFGVSIAAKNGIVAIGKSGDSINGDDSGSAYLFDLFTGSQIMKLLPSDGAEGDLFGRSIAINDNVIAIGASHDDDNGSESGSVYIFDLTTGIQTMKLLPSDGAEGDLFGRTISVDGEVLAVAAEGDDDNGIDSGSAYLFDVATGTQLFKLLPNDGASGDGFGVSISTNNDLVVVGAPWDDQNGNRSGSAYLFDISTGDQIAKLLASDGVAIDNFGSSIAISDGTVAVGALFGGTNGSQPGAAYVFDVGCILNPYHPDLTGDGELNFFDVSVFLTYFQFENPLADFTGDGQFNFFDVSAFLAAFSSGCP